MKRKYSIWLIAAMLFVGKGYVPAQNNDLSDDFDENEVMMPECLIQSADSLLDLYNSRMYLKVDTNCNVSGENRTYSEDVYIDRLSRLPNTMEMAYNSVVRGVIDKYTGRLRRHVSYMLGAVNFYMPIFEEALEKYGLPLELKYLPVIESALNPSAVSKAGAAGLWQFMVETGRQYGLKVNSLVDERRDPLKSSDAAARYLKDLYAIYGDWNLVIAAYNCGPANVRKAMHRSGKSDFWEIYPYLPRETQGYVPAFIGANYVMNYYCMHNIAPMKSDLPAKTDTVMINRNIHFDQITGVVGISKETLRSLNPQYRKDIVNGNAELAPLTLPADRVAAFIDNYDSITSFKSEQYEKRLEVKVSTPVVKKKTSSYKSRKGYSKRGKGKARYRKNRQRTVKVGKGQTLSQIARKNHTTVKKLKRLNGLKGNTIRAGKKLRVR